MASQSFISKRHDTAISPVINFTAPAGVTWNLQTVGVTLKFVARLPDAAEPKIVATCVATAPWQVRYDPIPADVDTIGTYDVEVEVTLPTGKKATFPNVERTDAGAIQWKINPDYDNT